MVLFICVWLLYALLLMLVAYLEYKMGSVSLTLQEEDVYLQPDLDVWTVSGNFPH